jgi:outer membrane lipoprotein-sorting protein
MPLVVRIWLPVLLLVLAGCSLAPSKPQPQVAEVLLWQALAVQQQEFSSIRGVAKIRIDRETGSQRSTQVVLAEKPDRFRAEVLSMFGLPLLSVASDGELLAVSIPPRHQFYQGPPSAENLQRFTHVPLAARDLVQLLLHQIPLIDYRHSHAEPGPRLVLERADGVQQQLDFAGDLTLVGASYFDQNASPWMTVRYTEFTAGLQKFPRRLEVALPQLPAAFQLELSELEINPVLSADKFSLPVPAGSVVRPLL